MADLNPSKSTTTSLNTIQGYTVSAKPLDYSEGDNETYWYFSNTSTYFGYYKQIPELKKALDALAMWTAGKGYTTRDALTKIDLDRIQGWGEDTMDSILENMIIVKKLIGDAFAEIIRDPKTGRLINLKPISPERVRLVIDDNGLIKRYDVLTLKKAWKEIPRKNMLHLCNDRVGDEIHGTSVIEACKWVIEARNEAMDTYRKILRRSLALGVLYIDSDDAATITSVMAKVRTAVDKGEMLVLPMKTADIKDSAVSVKDFLSWISYLENFFYQAVGIPKIILGGSQEFTEASSKVGYLTFEQVYMSEQRKLEQDLWNQVGIFVKFERPISLKDEMAQSEAKNTGQVGFQPNDTVAGSGK